MPCQVLVQDEQGQQIEWVVVGEGESTFYEGGISWKSVVAKALLGKKVGDFVVVNRPKGSIGLDILEIRFRYNCWKG